MPCLFSSPAANAQFWKKIFKGEKSKEVPSTSQEKATEEHKSTKTESKGIFTKKRIVPDYPNSSKKERYRVDILMPLNLDVLVQDNKPVYKTPPQHAVPAINFYEGVKLAVEALNKQEHKLDIHIHDISSRNKGIRRFIDDPGFQQTDLIIGYVQSSEIPELAIFAKNHQINFLSVLSPSDAGIIDNPYFLLVQPTLTTHTQKLVDYALNKHPLNPKYLFYLDDTPVQKESLNQLEKSLNQEEYIEIDCAKSIFNKDSLVTIFDSTRTNIIFINILSTTIASSVLKELSGLTSNYRFEVYGMPSWKTLNGINTKDSFPGLEIYYTSPFYYELNSRPGKELSETYKKQYGPEPSEMVFRGFESLYWMADLLKKYGNRFNDHIHDVRAVPFTRYTISPTWNEKNDFLYMENKNLYIFHYKDGFFNIEQ